MTTRALSPNQFGLFAQAILVMGIAGLCRGNGTNRSAGCLPGSGCPVCFFQLPNESLAWVDSCGPDIRFLFDSQTYSDPTAIVHMVSSSAIPLSESLTMTNSLMLQKQFRFKVLGIVEISSLLTWLATLCLLLGRTPGFFCFALRAIH